MKKAVMFGAGKIGRGFIGQKMHDSGYEVCFLDAVPGLVSALNAAGRYHVFYISNDGESQETIENFKALLADSDEAAGRIAECDLMATAVGVPNLQGAAAVIARGVKQRAAAGGAPLNIIMAENQLGVEEIMRDYLNGHFDEDTRRWADENLGILAASIQRMVPQADQAHLAVDPLGVVCEPFSELPVDKDGIRGELPDLEGMKPSSPFMYEEKRKLFMHNMAHALSAYLAYQRGLTWIWEAMEDDEIRTAARQALSTVAQTLSREYDVAESELEAYADSLLERFANRSLGDTVARVGADPLRKLRRDDRLVGAAEYVLSQGGDPGPIVRGIAAGLAFDPPDDASAVLLQEELASQGMETVLRSRLGLAPDSELAGRIQAAQKEDAGRRHSE